MELKNGGTKPCACTKNVASKHKGTKTRQPVLFGAFVNVGRSSPEEFAHYGLHWEVETKDVTQLKLQKELEQCAIKSPLSKDDINQALNQLLIVLFCFDPSGLLGTGLHREIQEVLV